MSRQTRHNRKKRNFLREVKLERGCEQCGYKPKHSVRRLHFHHRDPNTKQFDISNECHSRSFSELIREIEKCDVLCELCHTDTPSYGNGVQ